MKTRRHIRTYSKDKALVDERRKQIIESATELFREKGYQATTTREMANACGLSPGSLYWYIGTKSDVLHLIAVQSSTGPSVIRKQLNNSRNAHPSQKLRDYVKAHLENADMEQDRMIFYDRDMNRFPQEDRQLLRESQAEHIDTYEKMLREGIETGEFEIDDPFFVAQMIHRMVQDWALRRRLFHNRYTIDAYLRKVTETIFKLIMAYREQLTATKP